jgi:predicted transcriptional regulator
MELEGLYELNEPRDFALKSYLFLFNKAKEVGEENQSYVLNALKTIDAYSYNRAVVKKAVKSALRRLERKRAVQLLTGSSFRPPDPDILRGDILIAYVVGSNLPVALSFRHINENMGIWGRAGSGKTNLCQILILQLVRAGKIVRTFDYKDEYRDLLGHVPNILVLNPKCDRFNPLEPVGDPKDWLQFLADTLQQDFKLKPETKFMLLNYTDELYKRYDVYDKSKVYPSIHNLREFLTEEAVQKTTSASKRGKIYTCLEIIDALLSSIGEMLDCNSGYTEEALSKFSLVSYEMSNSNFNLQSWLTKLRLKHLYQKCFSGGERNRLKVVGVFEEAKMLFSEGMHKAGTSVDYIKQLITQARSSGFGAIITDQNKNELADFVLNNLSCQICFNLGSPKEIRATGYSLGCNEEQIKQIHYLKIPNAIMSISGHAPFMVRIPKSPVSSHISDDELRELIQPRLANLNCLSGSKVVKPRIKLTPAENQTAPEKTLSVFLKEIGDFLSQIKENVEMNISQIYSALNLSGRRGDKIKRQLMSNGLIEEETIHTGKRKRPSKRLKVTEKGERLLQWIEKKAKEA